MANLKQLRLRIKTIRSTKKITKAMQMVSASKLRKARMALEEADIYHTLVQNALQQALSDGSELSVLAKIACGLESFSHTKLLVVIGSDRGLCGGFNNSVLKLVRSDIRKFTEENIPFKVISIGKKPSYLMSLNYGDHMIEHHNILGFGDGDVASLAKVIIGLLEQKNIGSCDIYFSEFKSVISQVPTKMPLFPLVSRTKGEEIGANCELEGDNLINYLINLYIIAQLHNVLLESSASEEGARTTAMDNATRNAEDLIDRLTIVMNRTRQATITNELIEIISGAEAL
ncbi:MAG: hypothetical protein RLZZ59_168 [Pseudomonadota bacterium]|jgi:F-type H+-transporting ATPase subunit gamma